MSKYNMAEYKRSGTDCYQIAGKEETTQMFKIAICDDENLFTEELKELISGYMMEKGLTFEIDTYSSGEALIELGIEVVRYTIVFLDINMEKVDGIKTAEMIRKVSREVFIVFVTAYVDYSLEGYRLDVVRYLLKGNVNFQSKVNECMDAIIDKMNYSVTKGNLTLRKAEKKYPWKDYCILRASCINLSFMLWRTQKQFIP